jgi:hypothetical protein
MKPINLRIAEEPGVREQQVAAAISLLDGGAVPFVARYRKEATGALDDAHLRAGTKVPVACDPHHGFRGRHPLCLWSGGQHRRGLGYGQTDGGRVLADHTASLGSTQNFGGYLGGALAPTVTGFIVPRWSVQSGSYLLRSGSGSRSLWAIRGLAQDTSSRISVSPVPT